MQWTCCASFRRRQGHIPIIFISSYLSKANHAETPEELKGAEMVRKKGIEMLDDEEEMMKLTQESMDRRVASSYNTTHTKKAPSDRGPFLSLRFRLGPVLV